MIRMAEAFANRNQLSEPRDTLWFSYEDAYAHEGKKIDAHAAARAAASAARIASKVGVADKAAATDVSRAAADAAKAAADAGRAADGTSATIDAIAADYNLVVRESKFRHWTNDTSVPPDIFGELWPQQAPLWAKQAEEWDEEKAKLKKLLNISVEEIELSNHTLTCLKPVNITTVGQLAMKTENELLNYRDFGKWPLNEIKEKLAALGLTLGMTFSPELLEPLKGGDLAFDLWIDPGQSSVEDIQALFQGLSDLNRAHGGSGLSFVSDKDRVWVLKEA